MFDLVKCKLEAEGHTFQVYDAVAFQTTAVPDATAGSAYSVQIRAQAGHRQLPKRPQVIAVTNGGGPIAGCMLLTATAS